MFFAPEVDAIPRSRERSVTTPLPTFAVQSETIEDSRLPVKGC